MLLSIDYNICLNRNGYVNRQGTRQVVVEIYQNGRRTIVNTHVRVAAADFACGRIQPTNPDHDLLNRRLRRIVRHLMELEDEMVDAGQEPTPQRIAEAYRHHLTRSATIAEWIASVIEPSARKGHTKDIYHTLQRSLEQFHPGLCLHQLTYDLICRWQDWMRTQRRLSENTIACRMKTLRCLVSEAVKRDVMRPDEDPFRRIRIPEIKARHEHLDQASLSAIEHADLPTRRLRHVRDAFLFCCYTGLRWSDFSTLTTANLSGNSLILRQQKTGRPLCIPLATLWAGRPLQLLERYRTPERLAAIGTNKQANADLRRVGQAAALTQRLHWHLARHTCATLLKQRGLRMQEIQYILGHSKQQTTERHYAETLYDQVQDSLRAAFPLQSGNTD